MPDFILALDVGTTTVRAIAMNESGELVAGARAPAAAQTPAPGLLEQDARAIFADLQRVIADTLRELGIAPRDLAALGITSSRANIVVWDARTGDPVAPMVSWQDLRGAARALELQALGFMVTHQTAASKFEAVLRAIDRGVDRVNSGALLWGNIDTFIAWKLSGGAVYAMDESHACATGYYDYFTGTWNERLLSLHGVDARSMPMLIDTFGVLGDWQGVSIAAMIADQQSAALAQGCLAAGVAKVTIGTSATFDVHSGAAMLLAPGAYPLVHWRADGARHYCVEGMVNTAGAFLDWTAQMLGVDDAAALGDLAATQPHSNGVAVLPALQGLGTPHADPLATARVLGLTRATNRAHIARAAFEAIAFRIREIDDAVYALPELTRDTSLRVDGGGASSDFLLQLLADALGRPVERLTHNEATALGAALAAGVGIGAWSLKDVAAKRHTDRAFIPQWSADERDARFAQWQRAVLGERA
ncbi:MAG: hypothetical protein HC809_09025 [Gammaproteobacteria bacterium]|nr:hypothetical protein [Gammaproteobacteria bacterium]